MPSQRHEFWDTQPISKLGKEGGKEGFILDPTTLEDSKENIKLPDGYEWSDINMEN